MQIKDEIKHLITKNTELQGQVDELTTDRDNLRERVAGLEAELAAREGYPDGFIPHSELFERLGDAERERDELRRQVSELRELNDSLHARIEEAREALS